MLKLPLLKIVSNIHMTCFDMTCFGAVGRGLLCYCFFSLLLDLFLQGGIKLNRRIKIKDERLKLTCRSHTFKTVLKVRRGNTLAGIYEMVYPIFLPSIRYSFRVY